MNGVLRLATGLLATCEEEGCHATAGVVVGARHLCAPHAWEEEQCWKALAHLQLRPMSREEDLARKEGK